MSYEQTVVSWMGNEEKRGANGSMGFLSVRSQHRGAKKKDQGTWQRITLLSDQKVRRGAAKEQSTQGLSRAWPDHTRLARTGRRILCLDWHVAEWNTTLFCMQTQTSHLCVNCAPVSLLAPSVDIHGGWTPAFLLESFLVSDCQHNSPWSARRT